jgi:hypothetical protein
MASVLRQRLADALLGLLGKGLRTQEQLLARVDGSPVALDGPLPFREEIVQGLSVGVHPRKPVEVRNEATRVGGANPVPNRLEPVGGL